MVRDRQEPIGRRFEIYKDKDRMICDNCNRSRLMDIIMLIEVVRREKGLWLREMYNVNGVSYVRDLCPDCIPLVDVDDSKWVNHG